MNIAWIPFVLLFRFSHVCKIKQRVMCFQIALLSYIKKEEFFISIYLLQILQLGLKQHNNNVQPKLYGVTHFSRIQMPISSDPLSGISLFIPPTWAFHDIIICHLPLIFFYLSSPFAGISSKKTSWQAYMRLHLDSTQKSLVYNGNSVNGRRMIHLRSMWILNFTSTSKLSNWLGTILYQRVRYYALVYAFPVCSWNAPFLGTLMLTLHLLFL
jgi:hypothetical protein